MRFILSISDDDYTFEFTRDSIRLYEQAGGSMSDMREKMMTSIDCMVFAGLAKHHRVSLALAKSIADKAVDEYGLAEFFYAIADKFLSVFTNGVVETPKKVVEFRNPNLEGK